MTKSEQTKYAKDQLKLIIDKVFQTINQFPEGNDWGEIEIISLIKRITEFDPPIADIIKYLKRIDHRKEWLQDSGNPPLELTQEEIDKNKEAKKNT